jgi:transcriptional regulator with XRE-family HTH domain
MAESTHPSSVFPERLRRAREYRELSQGSLASRAKLQGSAVSHFESGTRKPSFDNLKRLADALDVTTDYLLGRSNEMGGSAVRADSLYRHYASLTAEDQDTADELINVLAQKARKKREQDS